MSPPIGRDATRRSRIFQVSQSRSIAILERGRLRGIAAGSSVRARNPGSLPQPSADLKSETVMGCRTMVPEASAFGGQNHA